MVRKRLVFWSTDHPLTGVANVNRRAKSDVLRTFGTTVRTYRLQAGLTQEALAEQAGVDRTYVGGVERGERNAGLVNVSGWRTPSRSCPLGCWSS
jgi:DNA-binding XRE family transcriptional regulator